MATAANKRGTWRPADSLPNRLMLIRTGLNLSQRKAAEITGISYGEWQGMETGRGTRRIDLKIAQISMALGVDRDWLMWGGPLEQEDPHPTDTGEGVSSRLTESNRRPFHYE